MKTAEVITKLGLKPGELLNLVKGGTLVVENHQVTYLSLSRSFPQVFPPIVIEKVETKTYKPRKSERKHITFGSASRLPDETLRIIKVLARDHTIRQISDALGFSSDYAVRRALELLGVNAKRGKPGRKKKSE